MARDSLLLYSSDDILHQLDQMFISASDFDTRNRDHWVMLGHILYLIDDPIIDGGSSRSMI